MKYLIQNIAYQLTRKRIREDSLMVSEVRKKWEELSFFSLSTNTIISFEHEGTLWYFRECPKILPPDAYWADTIDRFFDSLGRLNISKAHFSQNIPIRIAFGKSEIISFRKYLNSKHHDRDFRKMLKNADKIAQSIHFSIWGDQKFDAAFWRAYGLEDLPEDCRDIAIYFLWNMRSAASNLRLYDIVRGKRYSFFSAVRMAASRIVAEELGLEHLITPFKWCCLVTDNGCVMFGTMSPAAPGHRMIDLEVKPMPSLQRELLCLNVLDLICNQPDHGPNNYNVAMDDNGCCRVCAFDNDNAQTFFPWFTIYRPQSGGAPLVDRCRGIQRPYIDKQLACQLRSLSFARIHRRLKPYLNWLQIVAVFYRARAVSRAMTRLAAHQPDVLLEPSQWSMQTLAEEMSGKYGDTYLRKTGFLHDASEITK